LTYVWSFSFSERRSTSEREVFDRIISVDDDDEDDDISDAPDVDDHDSLHEKSLDLSTSRLDRSPERLPLHTDRTSEQGEATRSKSDEDDDDSDVDTDSDKSQSKSKNNNNNTAKCDSNSVSASVPQNTRPKIWSVMDVLGNKDSSTNSRKSSSSPQSSPPAVICSRQTSGPAFLNAHHAQAFRAGTYPLGLNGYPFSFSHTTLSYPYALSGSTSAKSDLTMSHVAAIRASEQAFKEGLVEKAARMQSGLFSPARELDGLRVRNKIVM